MSEPIPDDRLAELHNAAWIDNEPGTFTHFLSLALREALAEVTRLRAQQGTPRVQYGVRYPGYATVSPAPSEETARVWVEQYAELDPESLPRARVQRRTVTTTRSATDWEDVDD